MERKKLATAMICLLCGLLIIPVGGAFSGEIKSLGPLRDGHTLYVGGSGPGNYTTIQAAINASTDGDTIFVYSGIYHEQLYILKSIHLIGESKNTTFIDALASYRDCLILVEGNNIIVSGFTLQANYGNTSIISADGPWNSSYLGDLNISGNIFSVNKSTAIGIYAPSKSCVIADNIFYINDGTGIIIYDGRDCVISGNSFTSTNYGMAAHLGAVENCIFTNNVINDCSGLFGGGRNITITKNFFTNATQGISLQGAQTIQLSNNTLFNGWDPIELDYCHNATITFNSINNPVASQKTPYSYIGIRLSGGGNIISHNLIRYCTFGVYLEHCYENIVSKNTFKNNRVHARFTDSTFNVWNQNYWGRPRILPKPIFGSKHMDQPWPGFFEFDWHPAKKPYVFPMLNKNTLI